MDDKDNNINQNEETDIIDNNDQDNIENLDSSYEQVPQMQTGSSPVQNFATGFMQGVRNSMNPNNANLARGINSQKKDKNNNENKNNEDTKKKLNTKENNKNKQNNPLPTGTITQKQQNNNDKENKESGLKKKDNGSKKGPLSKLNPFSKKDDNKGGTNQVGDQIKGAAKKGIKAIWMLIPLPIKIIVLGLFLLIILFVVLLTVFTGSNSTYGSSYCSGASYDISDIADISDYKTVMALFEWNWSKTSESWNKFYSKETIYTDENDFLRSEDAYVVALGSYFGEVGDRFVVTMEDGQEFIVVKGDEKSDHDAHIDPTHRYHTFGDKANILEFIFGCGTTVKDPKAYGFQYSGTYNPHKCDHTKNNNMVNKLFPGNLKSIRALESDNTCNFNGQFIERTTSIYTDHTALQAIFSVAPLAKLNYAPLNLRYQCVTYAKLRAIEILNSNTVLTSDQKQKAISQVGIAQGNGWAWTAEDNPNLKGFSFDKTCTDFRAGSIIAFSGSGADCEGTGSPETGGVKCGHVAIIESVDHNNKKFTISDSYNDLQGAWHSVEYDMEKVNKYYGGCRGITHLLSYTG